MSNPSRFQEEFTHDAMKMSHNYDDEIKALNEKIRVLEYVVYKCILADKITNYTTGLVSETDGVYHLVNLHKENFETLVVDKDTRHLIRKSDKSQIN